MIQKTKNERAVNLSVRSKYRSMKSRWRRCNLCTYEFHPRTVFDRYCPTCKEKSELLRFSDCLPELDAAIVERISA